MFTTAVVEDEYWAMQAILSAFSWEKYGFEVIIQSNDSQAALEQILKRKPNVVITDVCMPALDGFGLMKRIKEAGLNCEFIIISGYSEFEYAKRAISMRVFDYVVKPVDSEDADNLLERLRDFLNRSAIDFSSAPSVKNEQFQKMLDYIHLNFAELMHITKLSKKFFINTSYCCKLFEQTFDMNFTAYVKDVRMKNAKRFLQEGKSVKETAQLTGYTDYFYFIKAYKKYYGVTPSEFRKMN
ncbi:MAG: response regulator [Clostridiales bacterium]|nr:response regulator [Clostridiales bacterium]